MFGMEIFFKSPPKPFPNWEPPWKKNEISEDRINYSVKKILINKFELGLFDNPFVDENLVAKRVGTETSIKKGLTAQKKSIVLLKNQIDNNKEILPLKKNIKIFVDGLDKKEIKKYCEITGDPKDSDYIIVQLRTVFNGNQPSGIDRPIDNFLSTIFPKSKNIILKRALERRKVWT